METYRKKSPHSRVRLDWILLVLLLNFSWNQITQASNFRTREPILKLLESMSPEIKMFNESNQLNWDSAVQDLADAGQIQDTAKCYEPEINGRRIDMFDSGLSLKTVVDQYYQSYPNKTITSKNVESLVESIKQIVQYCAEQTNSNKQKPENSTAILGFTDLSDYSDEQIKLRLGAIPKGTTNDTKNFHRFSKRGAGSPGSRCTTQFSVVPSELDWRQHNVVTRPKDQQECGSCWTFATTGAIESAYLINRKTKNPYFDLSEQEIIDCAKVDGCQGGNAMKAFGFVKENGLVPEIADPYRMNDNACSTKNHNVSAAMSDKQNPYLKPIAHIEDYCLRSKFRYGPEFTPEILSEQDIVNALAKHGPLYAIMDCNPRMAKNYRSGIMHGPCTTNTNHAVLLVGYTPRSWIIKNSWGQNWGQKGFFELARGVNMCGINTEIAYPIISDSVPGPSPSSSSRSNSNNRI